MKMKFYYMTRTNPLTNKLEYFQGMIFQKNKMHAQWSAHWMGSGNMTVAFSSTVDGFDEIIKSYPAQFTEQSIKTIELDE